MRRLIAVAIVVFPLACQAVTGDFSVGAGGRDSGAGSNDGEGVGDSATGVTDAATAVDAPSPEASSCACTPAPPSGWTLVALSTSGAPCGGPWNAEPTTLHDGISAPAPTCGCTCGAPTGVSCAIEFENGCPVPVTNLASNTCVTTGSQVNFPGGGTYSVSGGSCAPEPTSSIPPVTWANTLTSCNAALPIVQGSCSTGDLCAPPVPSGFQLCAAQEGDVACPFGTKHTEYTGDDDDTRACTACSCGAASAVQCGGTIEEFTSNNCTGAYTNLNLPVAGGGTCQGSRSSLEYIQCNRPASDVVTACQASSRLAAQAPGSSSSMAFVG